MSKNIALYGGVFNPIHTDHVNIIEFCLNKLHYDEVWVIPNAQKFFQNDQVSTRAEDRLAMIKIAVKGLAKVKIITDELYKKEATYTYDTVLKLKNQYPDDKFSFVIGSDNVKHLKEWYKFKKLKKLVKFIIMKRTLHVDNLMINKYRFPVHEFENLELKSEQIRKGHTLQQQIPGVNDYINDHLLYLEKRLAIRLPANRLEHSFNVAKTAKDLALKNDIDGNKAYLAGAYHDITKYWLLKKHETYIKPVAPEALKEDIKTFHAMSGSIFAKNDLQIKDQAVLDAIKYHTQGAGPGMSPLAMIVYIADKISPERDYPNVEKYRALAKKDLKTCYLAILKAQYERLKDKLDANSILAKNIKAWEAQLNK